MQQVVALLPAQGTGRRGDRGVTGVGQHRQADVVSGVVEVLTGDRVRPVPVGALDDDRVAVAVRLPAEGQRVHGVPPGGRVRGQRPDRTVAGHLGRQPVPDHRVAHLVLRDRRERQVLLDVRRDAGPQAVTVPHDELVVAQCQQQVDARVHHRSSRPRCTGLGVRLSTGRGRCTTAPAC